MSATMTKPIAEVELTCVGPKLKICGVEVHWWLGCSHDERIQQLAAQINAAFEVQCADNSEPN